MITKKCLDFSWPSSMLMCSRVLVEVTALSVKLGAVLEPYLSSRQADSDISLTSFWLWCSSLTTRMDLMRLSINIAMHTTKNTPVAQIEKNTGKFLYITVCSWLFIWMWLSLGIWIFLIWLFFFFYNFLWRNVGIFSATFSILVAMRYFFIIIILCSLNPS